VTLLPRSSLPCGTRSAAGCLLGTAGATPDTAAASPSGWARAVVLPYCNRDSFPGAVHPGTCLTTRGQRRRSVTDGIGARYIVSVQPRAISIARTFRLPAGDCGLAAGRRGRRLMVVLSSVSNAADVALLAYMRNLPASVEACACRTICNFSLNVLPLTSMAAGMLFLSTAPSLSLFYSSLRHFSFCIANTIFGVQALLTLHYLHHHHGTPICYVLAVIYDPV